jgi:predicted NBD/HSP70 family sugar kinase
VDLGGSDIKVIAMVDGELKFYRKMNWRPMTFTDAEQHLTVVLDMIHTAKKESGLTKPDGIGISTAGVVVNSKIMISGLCAGLIESQFRDKITPMGEIIKARFSGVDVDIAHDGNVAAIWAYVEMGLGNVLGLSLGTGLGAGFANKHGALTGFLCEIGKCLIDMHPDAPEHIHYHTRGPALHYLSQNAVFRLARENNIKIDHIEEAAERLRYVQKLLEDGNPKACEIFEQIGHYLAVAVVEFYDYFEMEHVVLFGRVTTGIAGEIILDIAKQVLNEKFKNVAPKVQLHLPVVQKMDANISREFGQAIAAAYLSSMKSKVKHKT